VLFKLAATVTEITVNQNSLNEFCAVFDLFQAAHVQGVPIKMAIIKKARVLQNSVP